MSDELTYEIVQLIAAARTAVGGSSEGDEIKPRPIEKVQPNVVHIETIIVHSSCGEKCSRAVPIELWTIRREWNSQQTGLAPLFLKNAIRSHLHFSQLNAWISTLNGRMPDGVSCTYRIRQSANESNHTDSVTEHTFPVCRVDRQNILVVSVKYVKSERMPVPVGLCLTLGALPTDQWLVPSPVGSPTEDCPLTATTPETIAISSLKHKPRPSLSPPSSDGPSPKFSAIAGVDDERPARRVLSASVLSPQEESRYDSHEIDILASRLQTIQGERGRQRTKSGGSLFNKITGLPLHSSPAPLSRQRNSLSASDIVLPESRLPRHQPGSLLGNFEESALNGRLDPVKKLDGFKLQLAATGAFSSPHTSLSVTAYFFDLNDSETAPSPYLGTCSLESLGRRGYRIPKQGTIQATLFNPQDTVVKVFVVTYDMSDMPPSSQTFIRQRTFLGTDENLKAEKHLVNLIHFRLATDRRCRLYLHTDVRMLFSQNNTLDALNLELNGRVGQNSGRYRLIVETELPRHPRYSPKK
ncbi:hypothetical protein V3C99_005518 [Haemonchus contortus]